MYLERGIGGRVDRESAVKSAGTFMSRLRAPPSAPWPDREPASMRSACCGLASHKDPNPIQETPQPIPTRADDSSRIGRAHREFCAPDQGIT
ncbi:hypothetical protein PoB_006359400 [Plakobranchus ocellatus]|uniref:Uncharacterized protein n=1 Tax=Plakobranchus ocellatus TaxID=259542 RepID=A0AAV4CYS2_9GAST|nr:hypothetical protein PoB_006359400 [Plakobranchus ocellatus]